MPILLLSNIFLLTAPMVEAEIENHGPQEIKGRDHAIGFVLTLIGLAFTIYDYLPGPDIPSAEITDFDISAKNLRVGEMVKITGKVRVNLGHVVDCGFRYDYNNTTVKVCAKVKSTGRKICFQQLR